MSHRTASILAFACCAGAAVLLGYRAGVWAYSGGYSALALFLIIALTVPLAIAAVIPALRFTLALLFNCSAAAGLFLESLQFRLRMQPQATPLQVVVTDLLPVLGVVFVVATLGALLARLPIRRKS